MRLAPQSWSMLLLAIASGCAAPDTPPDTSLVDAAALDASRVDAAEPLDVGSPDAAPAFDPARFDCRAGAPPVRTSPVPVTCALDPSCTGMRIASSHRGAGAPSHVAPENTLSAIRAAIALGADLVEMDVRPTSDGTLVLMHDASVERTTTGTGDVSSMTLAEVQALTLRTEGFRGDFSCDRVPTFAEALALADGRVGIVVDASKTDRVDLVVGALQAADAVDRVVFDTADTGRILEALSLEPGLRFLIRATTPEELDARLAAVAPARPVYVHIDLSSPATMAPRVHAEGLRVFALGFVADAQYERGSLDAYEALYVAGCDMLQSNAIDRLGAFLGR